MSADARGGLFALFVDRPVLTLMVTATLFALGAMSFGRLPLRFAPDGLTENRIRLFIPVRQDMSPREVEDRIIEPLEQLLRTIPGIKQLESSASSGRASVDVRLDEGMDPTLAAAEVRDRAQRAKLQWPPEVDRYFAWKEDASNIPLAFFQMLTPEHDTEWDYLIEDVVRPRLEAVEGVGRVEMWGSLAETIRIWFDRDKLAAHNVRFYELVGRLRQDNFTEPLGELDNGTERLLVRLEGKFRTLGEIEDYPVATGLRLADVAKIERVPSVRDRLSRFNQKYTYSGMIRTAAGVSPVAASANLRAEIARLRADPKFEALEFRYLFDQGEAIRDSLDTLRSSALQGGALAILVLFLFLRNFRFTIAIALAIPLALLVVGAQMFFGGESLNLLSMAGMTLAVGMVVDNSVVVLENIRQRRDAGRPLREACIEGAREVALAVTMATLTTVVVFLPMVFMTTSPKARVLFGSIGIPLSVALLASLGVALLLLPSGAHHLGKLRGGLGREATSGALSAWFTRVSQRVLGMALRHRWIATIAGILVCSLMVVPQKLLDFDGGSFGSMFRSGDVTVNLDLPRGLSLRAVEAEIKSYEDFLLARKTEWRIDSVSASFSRRSARVDVKFDPAVQKKEHATYRKQIETAWPRRPGIQVKLAQREGSDGGGGGGEEDSERNFVVRLYGRDSAFLMQLADDVRADLAQLPSVASVEIPAMDDSEEVRLQIDRNRMQDLQVRPDVLFGMVASGLQGQLVTNFEEKGREVRVVAEFDRGRNPTMLDLKETDVFSDVGTFQRLGDLASVSYEAAMGEISRRDGRTSVTILGKRHEGVGPKVFSEDLRNTMRRFPLPRGYTWTEDSIFQEQAAQMAELASAGFLSVTLVFLLMGVLFESVILPGAILVTIPFAILGSLWSLLLFHGSYDPMAVIGIILLAGIVVNNGIVLLDCITRLRAAGRSRHDAILEGVALRMRPILMTASTTIVGLLPMALFGESTGRGISYVSMSIAVAGGLTVSTLFTVIAVPIAYTWFDDLARWLHRVWQRAIAPSARPINA